MHRVESEAAAANPIVQQAGIVVSLASVVAPLAFSTIYFAVQREWPGAIWLSVVVANAMAVPLIFLGTRTARPTQPARG